MPLRAIFYKKIDKWYIEWQRVTTGSNEWYNKWQRVTTNNNKWQRVAISANFSFLQIREEPSTKHPKQNSLNLQEDFEEVLLN